MTEPLTWGELVEHCSRLHTTRTRPLGPWPDAPPREDSHMLDVFLDDVPGVVVPTRMHEPGFYVRSPNEAEDHWVLRSEDSLREFRSQVEAGRVSHRA